ncbi:MAG: DNA polymerase III subunit beta [Candidatus Omnitrophica bacterium]|nr:DNA polymerase III subunit beta [Candidatus Omnitrophota bacterium]MDD5670695.1 DNA polymerase III subunit beta [Candidatus Omnitrophota bacterium]
MEIRTSKSELLKSIALVGGVTGTKAATLPILGNILLEATEGDQLDLVGTDLEVGIFTRLPVKVKQSGSITIPSKKFQDIIRELPDGEIEITVAKNNAVNIKSGKSFFKIMGLPKEDFPKLPEWKEEDAIEFDQSTLKESLSLTVFAISSDETRYVLNGILISIKGKYIRFVATDGRRLAFVEKEFENKKQQDLEMIIPAKAVHEIIKILTWEGTVKIIPSNNQVIFHFGNTFLASRLIEGHFPNYEQVIPKDEKTQSAVSRELFLQAVRRASLLTSADSPAVKIDFVKGKVLVSSRSPNLGESKEEMEAEVNGKEVSIGFNPNYIMDVLKNLDVESVSLSLTDPDKPGLIKGKDGYKYVVMPMQLS